ncbi:hypothetical protein [Fontivita pretiosa]|uniref:hypothetical protein n=1 Tax=Fontivita pretiosa TaxID=2989684 RepID=UPI003D186B74
MSKLALGIALAMPGTLLVNQPTTMAQAAATETAAPPVNREIRNAVENYWHYGKVARYDLAAAEGQKVLASTATPLELLQTFEAVAAERKDNLDEWLLRWHGIEPMKDVTKQIIDKLAEGYRARRADPKFILEQISRLSSGERGYGNAMTRLRESGELAVPFLIDVLRDPAKKNQLPVIRRALRDLGRAGLNPLLAATQMQEWDTLTVIIGVLGDLGYQSAAPFVARVYESDKSPATVRAAAADALARLGVSPGAGTSASDLFYNLAERLYYDTSDIKGDDRFPTANVWYWTQTGLTRKQVPPQIFNEIMAMRACEYTLELGGSRSDDALSLWLASNYKREAELPEGATDPTRAEAQPDAHYYGVSAGSAYLNNALARAVRDRNAAVAFKVTRSLQQIVGQSNLLSGAGSGPLIQAMQFPDRKVRFEAAMTLAAALPQQNFEGSQRVVPLLAEAMAQTGQTYVVVVHPSQEQANRLVDELKKLEGINAVGATTAEGAIAVANTLPAVDVIVVAEDLGPGNVDQLFLMASDNARLAGAARLVMTKTTASIYEPRKVSDQLLSTTTATDAAALQPAIQQARAKAGGLPIDPAVATEYATRAGQLLVRIGVSRSSVYDLTPAKQTLLAALSDPRHEIVKLAGQVLAYLDDADAQAGLLLAATADNVPDDVRISLYNSLAQSAKLWNNKLDAAAIETLAKVVATAENLQVRSAAAEARGALNLPADQAKTLIVQQSQK